MNTIYSGAAEIGKVKATLGLIIGSIIVLVMMLISYFLITSKDVYKATIKSTVSSSTCSADTKGNKSCTVGVNYTVNNKAYTGTVNSNVAYDVGDSLVVKYNPDNPNDVTANTMSQNTIGYLMSAGSVVVGVIIVVYYVMVSKSKAFAALSGAEATMDLGLHLFK